MKIDVSAPGKTILHGEHAVVYGKAAIAVSLSLRTSLSLRPHEESVLLNFKNIDLKKEWNLTVLKNFNANSFPDADGDVMPISDDIISSIINIFELSHPESLSENQKLAVIAFLYLWIYISKRYNNGLWLPCTVDVDTELSVGSGMGSSASYSVCLATALLIFYGRMTPHLLPEDKVLINKWAFQTEKVFHGKPSGIDNSICTYGGALMFEDGKVVDSISSLPSINILLVNTNIPRNTKQLVASVKKKYEQHENVMNNIMNAIDEVSKECWSLLNELGKSTTEQAKTDHLQELVDINHHLLNALEVGHPKLDEIHDVAKSHGCSSKLTGAGGGGCAIVLLRSDNGEGEASTESLKAALEQKGFDVKSLHLGCQGVEVKYHD